MTSDVEKRFQAALIASAETAKREAGYDPRYFLRMISQIGGLATARQLLATSKPSDGFTTLLLARRLDLSLEALVIKPEYASLFAAEEIEEAKRRLREAHYKFEE